MQHFGAASIVRIHSTVGMGDRLVNLRGGVRTNVYVRDDASKGVLQVGTRRFIDRLVELGHQFTGPKVR